MKTVRTAVEKQKQILEKSFSNYGSFDVPRWTSYQNSSRCYVNTVYGSVPKFRIVDWRQSVMVMNSRNNEKKIAIVGAGIAGLQCAKILINNGFNVTVFDKESEVGGRMQHQKLMDFS